MEKKSNKPELKNLAENFGFIKKLRYGNMDLEQTELENQENIFTTFFDDFKNKPFPSLVKSFEEIEYLNKLQDSVLENPNFRENYEFIRLCDTDIHAVFESEFKKIGVKYEGEYLEKVQQKLGSLIMQLKNHYNRPRPYQFALYTAQDLHPFPTRSGHSPAYPSGHACQAHFLMALVAFKNPKKTKPLLDLAKKIADTRLAMGVHYPSDNLFGERIAKALAREPEIRLQYFDR